MTDSHLHPPSPAISSIGTAALDWLSGQPSGKVLASVTGAVYLLDAQEQLFWLAPENGPMHRRCIQVSFSLPDLPVDSSFQARDGCLLTQTGLAMDFSHAGVWKPPDFPAAKKISFNHLANRVYSAYRLFPCRPKPSGWGALIPSILQGEGDPPDPEDSSDGIISSRFVWPTVKAILFACREHDFASVFAHAKDLVGLGTGLTPSGDDFLGGLFFSLALLRHQYPEISYLSNWNEADFIQHCKEQTNLISFTLMKDHSAGHTLEPLHGFANILLQDQAVEGALPFAIALAGVGHSTGWDLLTGFLAGMSVTFP